MLPPVNQQSISFDSHGFQLSGTITIPEGAPERPAILLLPGSGQIDRDDNAKTLKINLFTELVSTLNESGFITLRYDKRGVGESQGDYWSCGFDDLLDDAEQAISFLSNEPGVDSNKVFVLGHSEGASIALRLAARGNNIAGVIALAGFAKTGEETMLWQTKQVGESLTGFNAFVIRVLKIDLVNSLQKNLSKIKQSKKDSIRIKGSKINAKWMREFLAYDPKADFKNIKAPVLAITGSHDIQVDPEDLKTMKQLTSSDFESHSPEGLSHLLRQDDHKKGLATYKSQAKMPVDQNTIKLIADWLALRAQSHRP